MENNVSLGTYSFSTDGVSINYSVPSFLPKEDLEKIVYEREGITEEQTPEKRTSFDALLKGILEVPKGK